MGVSLGLGFEVFHHHHHHQQNFLTWPKLERRKVHSKRVKPGNERYCQTRVYRDSSKKINNEQTNESLVEIEKS